MLVMFGLISKKIATICLLLIVLGLLTNFIIGLWYFSVWTGVAALILILSGHFFTIPQEYDEVNSLYDRSL